MHGWTEAVALAGAVHVGVADAALLKEPLPPSAAEHVALQANASEWLITLSTLLQHGAPLYLGLYAAGIIFFCFFYSAVQFNSEETAEGLKRHGGFIPGIRPGKATEEYFDYLLSRITVIGAAYLVLICLIPEIAASQAGIAFTLGDVLDLSSEEAAEVLGIERAAFRKRLSRALQRSAVPKLLLTADPGVLVPAPLVTWCREHLPNLEVVELGPGLHYLQEDHPDAIGRAIADWIRRT